MRILIEGEKDGDRMAYVSTFDHEDTALLCGLWNRGDRAAYSFQSTV